MSTQQQGEWAQNGIGGVATDGYTSIAELLRFIVLTCMGRPGVADADRSKWQQRLHAPESYQGCHIRLTIDRTDDVSVTMFENRDQWAADQAEARKKGNWEIVSSEGSFCLSIVFWSIQCSGGGTHGGVGAGAAQVRFV